MALEKYRQKRNFSKTPEPKAEAARSSRQRFVVQRHDASKLHYDFRLETGGVLKSWAVPKGPSLNPADKRLAVMTEDHPVKYLTFEGYIPDGNYGAGQMDIWDKGTYELLEGRDLAAELEGGSAKIRLHGKRLQGAFALVKMKGRGDKQWLLIKKEDEFSVTEPYDIENPASSTGTAAAPAIPPDPPPAAPVAPAPDTVEPMLAQLADEPFDHPDWIFEPKLDGYRALARVQNSAVELYSRRGNSYNEHYQPIVNALENLQFDVLLDGEIVVLDEENRQQFNMLQNFRGRGEGRLHYSVFDLLYLDGRDLMNVPLRERRRELSRILVNLPGVQITPAVEGMGRYYYHQAAEQGLEGIIAKKGDSFYAPGSRSKEWLKLKVKQGQEAIIGGYTEARDSRPIGSLLLGVYEGDKLRFVGHCGTGFDLEEQARLHALFQPLIRKTPPFSGSVSPNAPVHWLRPQLICEVEFGEWTPAGLMRHAAYKGLRHDKAPRDIHREKPLDVDQLQQSAQQGKKSPEVEIRGDALVVNGTAVQLTNLDKVYWPQDGYTKYDLLNYYIQVSDYLLPYLKDRPLVLRRHPNGITDEGFFQKEVGDDVPEWAKTMVYHSQSTDRDVTYLVGQDLPTLLYMANLGCIEINPWNSRLDKLDFPDYAILDLDPGEKTSFEDVIEVAHATHDLLQAAGISACCKTSGSKGMHIVIPLGAKYTHQQARDFVKAIALLLQQRLPELTSLERSPKERRRQIYLDYLQNKRTATLVSAYSVRPRVGATVSAPLAWKEVKKGLHPSQFTIKTMPERLARRGDLFGDALGDGIDMLECLDRLMKL